MSEMLGAPEQTGNPIKGFARVVFVTDPFDVYNSMECHDTENYDLTLFGFLQMKYGSGFEKFQRPTICILNGIPYSRQSWKTRKIQEGDLVQFITKPGDVVTLVIAVVALVVAAVAVLLIPTPTIPGGQPQPDPVFTRKGQFNRTRPGEPIEVGYGYCRLYPSYGGRSYTLFSGNDQYQFNLLCLGQGYWDIEKTQIEDTAIEDFAEAEVEFVPPGGEMTLFRNNVETSAEVGGIELYGPNEEEYDGESGPFIINSSGTLADRLEFDTVCPQGLFSTSKKGAIGKANVVFEFETILVDDAGEDIVGASWTSLGSINLSASSTTPQRRTWGYDVPAGRYKVRAKRTSNASSSIRINHSIQWAGARAFLPNVTSFGDVTMMAVKIRASNNINDNTRSLFNVWGTRRLATYDAEAESWNDATGSTPATRSLVMAFCDAFRNPVYGGNLERFLNMPQLLEVEEYCNDNGIYFDWVFDQKSTVSETARAIARVARGVPTMVGSLMGIIRDAEESAPSAMFTPDNIKEGVVRREFKLFEFDPPDCIEVEYRNPTTWEPERVKCVLPGSSSDNPELVLLAGCLDRDVAYREGMFMMATKRWVRERLSFTTGLEGHIPQYGDLISVSHDLIRVGSSGLVLTIDNATSPGNSIIHLSDSVNFGTAMTYVLVIREKNGDVHGPITVTEGGDDRTVIAATPLELTDFYFSDDKELPIFQFGESERYAKLCKVAALKPSAGNDTVGVEAVNYDPRVHSFDTLDAPALYVAPTPAAIPAAPTASGLRVNYTVDDPTLITVGWDSAYGAKSYLLQESRDNIVWDDVTTTSLLSTPLTVLPGTLYLRLAAINIGQGAWTTWTGEVGIPLTAPPAPTNFVNSAVWQLDAEFTWDPLSVTGGFDIEVRQASDDDVLRVEEFSAEETGWTYTRAMAAADGAERSLIFALTSGNAGGDSAPVELSLTNELPGAPTSLTAGNPTGTVYPVSWTIPSTEDFDEYKVYASTTPGFTPGPGNLVYTGTLSNTSIDTGGVTTYWRVSSTDVWDDTEVFSAEASIAI